MLGKIKESIDKSLVSVSVKSGTYLETEKLKAKVGNVQEEIHNLKQELGEAIFAQWKNGGVNPQTIESACAALNRKEAEIAGYQAQIDQITREKARILGEELKPAAAGREGGVTCSCGKVNAPGARFCKACGKKLEAVVETAQETAKGPPLPQLRSPDGAGSQILLRVRPSDLRQGGSNVKNSAGGLQAIFAFCCASVSRRLSCPQRIRKKRDTSMYCTKCGAEMPDDALFCTACGEKIDHEDEAASETTEGGNKEKMGKRAWNRTYASDSRKAPKKGMKIALIAAAGIAVCGLAAGVVLLNQPKAVIARGVKNTWKAICTEESGVPEYLGLRQISRMVDTGKSRRKAELAVSVGPAEYGNRPGRRGLERLAGEGRQGQASGPPERHHGRDGDGGSRLLPR